MTKVLFLKEAYLELAKSVDYYENIYHGLGLDFEQEVKRPTNRLVNHETRNSNL